MKRKLAEEVRKVLEARAGEYAMVSLAMIQQDNGTRQIGVTIKEDGASKHSVVCIDVLLDRMQKGLITAEEIAEYVLTYGSERRFFIESLDFRCIGEVEYEDVDGMMGLGFTYELWFDVDAYFGTDTKDDDGCWINFYTWYMENGDVKAKYFIEKDDSSEEHDWELTAIEKEFFRRKMEDRCLHYYGKCCMDVINEDKEEFGTGSLKKIVGRRYESLELLKNDIEVLTGRDVNVIIESESDRLEEMDFMIDYEFEPFDIHTLYYLKDNAGRYYITEV